MVRSSAILIFGRGRLAKAGTWEKDRPVLAIALPDQRQNVTHLITLLISDAPSFHEQTFLEIPALEIRRTGLLEFKRAWQAGIVLPAVSRTVERRRPTSVPCCHVPRAPIQRVDLPTPLFELANAMIVMMAGPVHGDVPV